MIAPYELDARSLCTRLVGKELQTIRGRANRIVRVDPDDVVVATGRSPAGQRVPISWVQDALDRLRRDGVIEISVDAVQYRSAFVGAVLRELPGARVDETSSPPRILLDAS